MAAVLYVFRTLVDDDIPLNAGCLKPLQVIVPEGCMLNPRPPAAVVAGNVETSHLRHQRAVRRAGRDGRQPVHDEQLHLRQRPPPVLRDDLAAAPGAGPGFDGTSVVQTHMTNSRLTDPEVLEFRFPVRLESYAIRAGSGGAGRWRGGDGGVRRVRFLEPMTASILSNGRRRAGLRHGRRRSRVRWASTASSAPTAASRRWATSAGADAARRCVRDRDAGRRRLSGQPIRARLARQRRCKKLRGRTTIAVSALWSGRRIHPSTPPQESSPMNQRLIVSSALASVLALGLSARPPPQRQVARKSATASPRPARTTAPTCRARIRAPASPRPTTAPTSGSTSPRAPART